MHMLYTNINSKHLYNAVLIVCTFCFKSSQSALQMKSADIIPRDTIQHFSLNVVLLFSMIR